MGITRARLSIDEHFTAVPNEWARDVRLSRRARGLLVEIMSHRIGWHVTTRSLAGAGPEGRDAIRSAIDELLEHGYVKRSQGRASAGKFAEIEYELCDPPTVAGFADRGSAVAGFAVDGESATKKNISSEDHPEEDHLQALVAVATLETPVDRLWEMWPTARRSTRKVVERSAATAAKVASWDVILQAAGEHVRVWRTWPASDLKFVPLLSTWLNQERWTSAPPMPRSGGRPTPDDRVREGLDRGARLQQLVGAESKGLAS